MRKKLLAMLLCGVMVVSLASCGESAEESNSPSQNEPQQTISNEPTQSDDQEPENHTPEGDITFSELTMSVPSRLLGLTLMTSGAIH